uniref:Uncharacterized protein n=1 Tax=Arundo donax TaxID=35708 RepID=A0A0A8XQD6_ARUDO
MVLLFEAKQDTPVDNNNFGMVLFDSLWHVPVGGSDSGMTLLFVSLQHKPVDGYDSGVALLFGAL